MSTLIFQRIDIYSQSLKVMSALTFSGIVINIYLELMPKSTREAKSCFPVSEVDESISKMPWSVKEVGLFSALR